MLPNNNLFLSDTFEPIFVNFFPVFNMPALSLVFVTYGDRFYSCLLSHCWKYFVMGVGVGILPVMWFVLNISPDESKRV